VSESESKNVSAKRRKKKSRETDEDEKNLKTQATAHFFISDDFVLFFLR